MHGLMSTLRVDGGPEFTSPDFESACRRWGIDVSYRNKKEDGAYIERFIGTVQGWCSQESGASGSDPKKLRREPDRRDFAHFTLAEAEAWLARQILMRYHLECHSGLGISPLQAWRTGLLATDEPRAVVTNEEQFLVSFLPSVLRVISHDGVRLFNETYFSPEARAYVHPRIKRKVHYDPRCMGRAFVDLGKADGFIEVRYVDAGKQRLPKAEIDAARQQVKDANPPMFSSAERVALTNENRKARASSKYATKAARRKELAEITRQIAAAEEDASDDPMMQSTEPDDDLNSPVKLWREGPV